MIVLLNGAFGVGKSTTASKLRELVPTLRIADPELVGGVLMRAGRAAGRTVEDFQDLALWRRSVPWVARAARGLHRAPVVVPMTIWRPGYLDQIVRGLEGVDPLVFTVRLTATADTLRSRIGGRSEAEGSHAWCLAHLDRALVTFADPSFGAEVVTDDRTPLEVATAVADLGLW